MSFKVMWQDLWRVWRQDKWRFLCWTVLSAVPGWVFPILRWPCQFLLWGLLITAYYVRLSEPERAVGLTLRKVYAWSQLRAIQLFILFMFLLGSVELLAFLPRLSLALAVSIIEPVLDQFVFRKFILLFMVVTVLLLMGLFCLFLFWLLGCFWLTKSTFQEKCRLAGLMSWNMRNNFYTFLMSFSQILIVFFALLALLLGVMLCAVMIPVFNLGFLVLGGFVSEVIGILVTPFLAAGYAVVFYHAQLRLDPKLT